MDFSNDGVSSAANDVFRRPPIRRARPQLSCTPCRQGKLKCNRGQPVCDQCSKRARDEICSYPPPPPRNKQAQNMRDRIRNLESMVINMVDQRSHGHEDEAQSNGNGVKNISQDSIDGQIKDGACTGLLDQLRISSNGAEAKYVGAGHWSSVLNEIADMKEALEEDDDLEEEQDEGWNHMECRSTVTFGLPKPMTKSQLLAAMPPRSECDKILPLWFNSSDRLLYCIHAPTFKEEYKQFWKDPSSASVMWLAMLFSIMALGIIIGPRGPSEAAHALSYNISASMNNTNDHMTRVCIRLQQLASSAIVLADVARPQPYALETLMIYSGCEFLRRDDGHAKIWLMDGVTLRVAMRMGYHRDPHRFEAITPFQGEMRRRVWHVLNMMDTLVAFSIGLPAALRRIESDVRAPRNLYDSDISPQMTEMPTERPPSEITSSTYVISKSRVCVVLAEAAELSQRVVPPKHTEIAMLDERLQSAHAAIPEGMRVQPMEDCITDPPWLIMSRFNIELLYLVTRIVIHRNYLTAGQKPGSRFHASRKLCVDAALEILRYQNIIFHACQPDGQLNKVWWYMSSLNTYDFLLGAMIICLELNYLQSSEPASPELPKLVETLQRTHDLYANNPHRFRESVKGGQIIGAMLEKCYGRFDGSEKKQDVSPETIAQSPWLGVTDPELTPQDKLENLPPQIWGAWPTDTTPAALDIPEVVASEIDWTLWDASMQNQQNTVPQTNWAPTMTSNPAVDAWLSMSNNTAGDPVVGSEAFQFSLDAGETSYLDAHMDDMDWSSLQ